MNNVFWAWKCVLLTKKKLNTKSSTEAKIEGNSEYVLFNGRIIMVMEAQGYVVKKKSYIMIVKE